jgi:acyl-CoA oxidase
MLMKFAKVETSGEYIPPVHNKLSYGSMVKLRVDIVYDAAFKLAKAVTISTRYCTVRRQFHYPTAKSGLELETQVIRYSSVQHRLFPLLSTAYALFITSESLYQTFNQLMSKLEINDASMLPQVHATTCALKSWSTRRSTDGIEECRKAMGGHGFSMFSGVADLFATFIPSNTYEGDNFVLAQQTARFILKQLSHVLQGETPSPTVEYLALSPDNRFQFKSYDQILDPEVQIQLFGKRALSLATSLKQQLSKREWSDLNMECWSLNFAHAEYIIMKELHTRVDEMKSSEFSTLAPMLKSISDLVSIME